MTTGRRTQRRAPPHRLAPEPEKAEPHQIDPGSPPAPNTAALPRQDELQPRRSRGRRMATGALTGNQAERRCGAAAVPAVEEMGKRSFSTPRHRRRLQQLSSSCSRTNRRLGARPAAAGGRRQPRPQPARAAAAPPPRFTHGRRRLRRAREIERGQRRGSCEVVGSRAVDAGKLAAPGVGGR
nr:unnamed protein product [Digitaria exilis]